jgi:hypothetical protein
MGERSRSDTYTAQNMPGSKVCTKGLIIVCSRGSLSSMHLYMLIIQIRPRGAR